MAIRLLSDGTVEFDTVYELRAFRNGKHTRERDSDVDMADVLQSLPDAVSELNAELREDGIAPKHLGSGDAEKDALHVALVLVVNGIPMHSSADKRYPEIRAAVMEIFGVTSYVRIREAVATDNSKYKKYFSRGGYKNASIKLSPNGRSLMYHLRRGKVSKKAVKLAEAEMSRLLSIPVSSPARSRTHG